MQASELKPVCLRWSANKRRPPSAKCVASFLSAVTGWFKWELNASVIADCATEC